eukprot:TRINITY_DN9291_c2_g1_i1.p1 TRINITY_DN9291_c2_g1~~TRINITY_DN9291_c2_g1_i1.p1  ORF type:complete len:462 (+),score=53.12 TRINITY_DN9291_c2_g1_i1:28-1413(+)
MHELKQRNKTKENMHSVVSSVSLGDHPTVLNNKLILIATIGLFKTCVGTAVLSMPKAISNSGLVIFPILLFGFSVGAHYGCWLVAKTLDIIGRDDMDPAKVGEFSGGKYGKWFALTMCVLDPWGSTIAFFSTLADIIRPLLEEHHLFGEGTIWTSHGTVILALAVAVFPLMLSTKISEISWVNTLGVISLLAFTIGVLVNTIQHNIGLSGAPLGSADTNAVVALTVIAFAYDGGQLNVFPYYRDLPSPASGFKGDKLALISGLANYAGACCYFLVAILAYSTYRDDTKDDVLNNFGNSSFIYVTIKITFAISLLLTIPLTLFECTAVLREHVFSENKWTNIALNLALIGTAAIIASFVPSMYSAFAYVGATTATAWTMILPPLWFIFTVKEAYREGGINDGNEEEDELTEGGESNIQEETPLFVKNPSLPPKPSKIQLGCAWVFMITGCCAVPFFIYSTAI